SPNIFPPRLFPIPPPARAVPPPIIFCARFSAPCRVKQAKVCCVKYRAIASPVRNSGVPTEPVLYLGLHTSHLSAPPPPPIRSARLPSSVIPTGAAGFFLHRFFACRSRSGGTWLDLNIIDNR